MSDAVMPGLGAVIDVESHQKSPGVTVELAQIEKRRNECVKKMEDVLGSYTKRMMHTRQSGTMSSAEKVWIASLSRKPHGPQYRDVRNGAAIEGWFWRLVTLFR